ncbi:MAG: glycosyltransferase family 2 protein [Bacteroides sp.]|jgi:glycosyltransferase involved in cell wall biosynthesis|nr:glycosyltransferase family 2 protein [Bacteroides sp.]
MNNNTQNYSLTIIIPVYNEEDNIERLKKAVEDYLPQCRVKACALFVNDGSKDHSLDRIKRACENTPDFFYISLQKNSGLSAAMKAGIDVSESKFVGYMDADMQTDIRDFNLLLEYAEEYPLVTGIRAERKDSSFKLIQSKIANSFRRMMTHDGATDTGCPLKIIRTEYAKRIPFFTGMHRFLPALILLQDGGRFKEIPVRHYPRQAGVSKYHLWNRLVSPFKDCFAFRWMAHRYINYQIEDRNL